MESGKSTFAMVIPLDVKERLRQIAKEKHMSMSGVVVQLILNAPVEHPEEIGQINFEDIEKKKKEGD